MRAILEAAAIEEAQKRFRQTDLTHLKACILSMDKAAKNLDLSGFNQSDMSFHRYIWELSGNKVLERILNDLCLRGFMAYNIQTLALMSRDELEELVNTHWDFLRLLENKEGDLENRVQEIQNKWLVKMRTVFPESR